MLNPDLINDINIVLSYFENSTSKMESEIYNKYCKLKNKLQADNLQSNVIKGSVRAYLDAFNDWDNPILNTMGSLETKIDIIINGEDIVSSK